jgi:hypothetical protein
MNYYIITDTPTESGKAVTPECSRRPTGASRSRC